MPHPRTIAHRAVGLLARVLVAMLFGAIVSITIAVWAANTDRGRIRWIRTPATPVVPNWSVQVTGYGLFTTATFYPLNSVADSRAQAEASVSLIPDADLRRFARRLLDVRSAHVSVYGAGWPLQCIAGYQQRMPAATRNPSAAQSDISWRAPWLGTIDIPTRFLWRNLAADATLFGAPCLLLLVAISPLRAWRRRHSGRCPACAYDLNHNLAAGCPECGWNRKPRRVPEPQGAPEPQSASEPRSASDEPRSGASQ